VRRSYWRAHDEPSPEQHAIWSARQAQREATIGRGPGRVLDVGCGFGHFVRWALDNGWDAWGWDSDPWAVESTVVPGRVVVSRDELDPPFDVVTLWDVLEHVTDPVAFASSLRDLLGPGGRLFVCSPNFEALRLRWWWLRRDPARFNALVRPDEHPLQFTETGIRLVLERAGYERIELLRPPLANHSVAPLDWAVRRWPALRVGLFANAFAPGGPDG
jgi:2-polyprenyl-3-methyl-5-hydroxy-6-metoxy-1,4-benzoquinol methylase